MRAATIWMGRHGFPKRELLRTIHLAPESDVERCRQGLRLHRLHSHEALEDAVCPALLLVGAHLFARHRPAAFLVDPPGEGAETPAGTVFHPLRALVDRQARLLA